MTTMFVTGTAVLLTELSVRLKNSGACIVSIPHIVLTCLQQRGSFALFYFFGSFRLK